jgi:hypothetical protein
MASNRKVRYRVSRRFVGGLAELSRPHLVWVSCPQCLVEHRFK